MTTDTAIVERTNGHALNGVIHRPLVDRDNGEHEPPDIEPEEPAALTTVAEQNAIRAACKPLRSCEKAMKDIEDEQRTARSGDAKDRAKLTILAQEAERLKDEHTTVRGAARLAVLGALDASTLRASREYSAACGMLADAAAKLGALADYRDTLLGTQGTFDPLNVWSRSCALLAPPLALRPRGWTVAPDAYGRDCYWHADSPRHRAEVRRRQSEFRAEIDKPLAGARWPF